MDPRQLQILSDPRGDEDTRLQIVYELRRAAEERVLPEWGDDDRVLDVLTRIAGDVDEGVIHNEAAEALVQIWLTKGVVDAPRFRRLSEEAKNTVRSYLELNRPDLLDGLDTGGGVR